MPDLSKRAQLVVTAATAAYGDRWQSPLAEATGPAGISQQLLAMIAKGKRDVTDDVYRKVADALRKEAVRLVHSAARVHKAVDRMMAELEK